VWAFAKDSRLVFEKKSAFVKHSPLAFEMGLAFVRRLRSVFGLMLQSAFGRVAVWACESAKEVLKVDGWVLPQGKGMVSMKRKGWALQMEWRTVAEMETAGI